MSAGAILGICLCGILVFGAICAMAVAEKLSHSVDNKEPKEIKKEEQSKQLEESLVEEPTKIKEQAKRQNIKKSKNNKKIEDKDILEM